MVSKDKTENSLKLATKDNEVSVKVGDKIFVKLDKVEGVLPKNKIKIYTVDSLINIESI